MNAYITIKNNMPAYSLPLGEISATTNMLLCQYIKKHVPLRNKRYTPKEFFDIVETSGRASLGKQKILQLLLPMC